MDTLPQDTFMLMSFINTKLRDEYSSLEQFCEEYNISQDEIIQKLSAGGFEYSKENKKFW
ncbi:MAG: DUF4250 domain-containing protein [Bacteroidales bacterium]|nr:DUF4250 domain-containing protein [Bacteroidales bacterium]